MKAIRISRLFGCMLILMASMLSRSQTAPIADLALDQFPAVLQLADLTEDYKAVRLAVGNATLGGPGDLAGSSLFYLGGANGSIPDLFSLVGTYWTKGQTVSVAGKEFLVAYKLEVGLLFRAKPETIGASLKLHLLRANQLSAISPAPDVTKSRLEKALAEDKTPLNDPGLVPFPSVGTDTPVLAAILLPVFTQAKVAAQKTASLSNIKQAALAVLMYCGDNDDHMPYVHSTGAVVKLTHPYLKDVSIWWTSDGRRFLFNMAVSGVNASAIERPSETVLVYAEKPRSDGTREVAFVDGHAKIVKPEEWARYESTLRRTIQPNGISLPKSFGQEYNSSGPPK